MDLNKFSFATLFKFDMFLLIAKKVLFAFKLSLSMCRFQLMSFEITTPNIDAFAQKIDSLELDVIYEGISNSLKQASTSVFQTLFKERRWHHYCSHFPCGPRALKLT